jgi:BirA family transcriptional regulator, biotin operon repressor / biotin---[acetyl-CoA-carboxylase] ligase
MPEPAASRDARWDVRRLDTIDSTNRYALDEARAGAPTGLVAVADHQRAGRGRLGRSWDAAPGSSLLVSVLLRPALTPDALGVVTMAAGCALAAAVHEVAGFEPGLKWPNDLVVGDRKLAGLLAEADVVSGDVRAVVIGAGCNLTANAFPPELAAAATSCELESGGVVDRDALLGAFLDELAARVDDLAPVPEEYRKRSVTLGRRVRVDCGDRSVEGVAGRVDDTGVLIVRDDEGGEVSVKVGDVVHLRPTP